MSVQTTSTTFQKKAIVFAVAFLLLNISVLVSFTNSVAAQTPTQTKVVNKNSSEAAENSEPAKVKQHNIYLSLGNEHNAPLNEATKIFDCTDKVYSVLELAHYSLGKHQLSVRWFDPARNVREHTQYEFNVRHEKTRLWAWLSLSRGAGAGMLQWINPAAGLEDFIGIWEIDVKVDGKRLGKESFEVSC